MNGVPISLLPNEARQQAIALVAAQIDDLLDQLDTLFPGAGDELLEALQKTT